MKSVVGVVVTQDCDLIHQSFEAEPFAEILLASELPDNKWSEQFAAGRHPRRLHFRDTEGRSYEGQAKDRAFLDRAQLQRESPSAERHLSKRSVALIRSWLRKRYDRPAFPDRFDERLKPERERIKRVVTQYATDMIAIFIALDTKDELGDGVSYHVLRLTIVYDGARTESDRADKAAAEIAATLNGCDGIEVDDFSAVAWTEFSLADAAEMDAWDFDYLSYADE